MENDRLREELAQLRTELERSASVDPAARARLEALIRDIERLVDESEGEPESLGDRLADAVRNFEDDHPQLALAVGRIAEALASLGI